MDKYIGRLLDNRYEILEVIGTGGMAVVYKARCHRLNRLVAIKILKDDYLQDEEFRRRFHSESQAVAMLSHPNIVSVYDVSSSINADYIVMELIDGITLKQYMEKKGVLNWKETLHFAIQIGKALEHAHSRGIVHRDIKPHNVMVLKNGSVKVTDFGIARVMSQSNTLTKEALGSVHYISPEQAKGGRVDSRSDIYSLGVVMYEMMSGRPPYDGESPVAVAIKHINGGAAMPSTLNPNIPGGLEQIIMHAMAVDPGERYTSTTKMLADMDAFRRDPGMLFDYNVPPLDEVIRIQKPPLILEPERPRTDAQRAVQRKTGTPPPPRRKTATPADEKRRAQQRKARQEEERRSNVATIAIIACSAVMVLAILIALLIFWRDGFGTKPELIEIPNLLGENFEELKKDPDFPFELQINKREFNSEYPEGQIYNQNPLPGEKYAKGSIIAVDVSLGAAPEIKTMPNLVPGWKQKEAEDMLGTLLLDLDIKIVEEHNNDVPAGEVIKTEPAADTPLSVGHEVTLYVSLGAEPGTMPNLVGKEREDAEAFISDAVEQLKLDVVYEDVMEPEVPAGCVVRTDPAADVEIKTGEKITVYVNIAAKLPNVVNLSADMAVKLLKEERFQNYKIETVENEKPKDTVLELCVDGAAVMPGTAIDVSSLVIIVVSTGPGTQINPGEQKTVTVNIDLPEDYLEAYTVKVVLAGVEIFKKDIPEGSDLESIPVEMTGSGVQQYIVYINDIANPPKEVDFTK